MLTAAATSPPLRADARRCARILADAGVRVARPRHLHIHRHDVRRVETGVDRGRTKLESQPRSDQRTSASETSGDDERVAKPAARARRARSPSSETRHAVREAGARVKPNRTPVTTETPSVKIITRVSSRTGSSVENLDICSARGWTGQRPHASSKPPIPPMRDSITSPSAVGITAKRDAPRPSGWRSHAGARGAPASGWRRGARD